jgi:hypothetical protein
MVSEIKLPELRWTGPYKLSNGTPGERVDDIAPDSAGVYLWTVRVGEKFYPHYVGATQNLRTWLMSHRNKLLSGYEWVYCPADFAEGRLRAVYTPKEAFATHKDEARAFVELLSFFVLSFPPDPLVNTERIRGRVELGLAQAIGDHFHGLAEPNVWDQSCAENNKGNKRQSSEPAILASFVVPEELVGVSSGPLDV